MKINKFRPIAIYLPQYHPTPENDEWWGKGFTEWRNVAKARPRFPGHYQPHIPADLGFYDLRLPVAIAEQEKYAKKYGIYGFCMYHYWFSGKMTLQTPAEIILKDKSLDLPIMFCWANENWSRAWNNDPQSILLEQRYSKEDNVAHFNYLLPFFKDERYIKIDGKPVLAIYRSNYLPDIDEFIDQWQQMAHDNGFEIYFCRFTSPDQIDIKYHHSKFNAAIEFAAHIGGYKYKNVKQKCYVFIKHILQFINPKLLLPTLCSYKKVVEIQSREDFPTEYTFFPGVFNSWDNAARKRAFGAFTGSTPTLYKQWLENITNKFHPKSAEENFVFINAWNEWAEGCHLEPDLKWGNAYLEATRDAFCK